MNNLLNLVLILPLLGFLFTLLLPKDKTNLIRLVALVLSLGFDASENEPLGYLRVTADGFAQAATAIAALRLPTAIVQEGGYNTEELGLLLARTLGPFL